jgi:long-subunit acyl-CoA synthetase (AMP-forming)
MKLTVIQVFEKAAQTYAARSAYQVKRGGHWLGTSWSEYRTLVLNAAKGLIELGVQPGKAVVCLGGNCPQWSIAALAAIHAGARPAGIYTTSSVAECEFVAAHAEAQIAVVEDREQLEKMLEARPRLPELRAMVLMKGRYEAPDVIEWDALLARGARAAEEPLQQRMAAQSADDVCTYLYTSGTTGKPKAVMMSHDNITWTTAAVLDLLGAAPHDRLISYLPMAHVAEQVVSIHGPMVHGATTYYAESTDTLAADLRDVRPTIFLAVPQVWERIQAQIQAAGLKRSLWQRRVGAWSRRVGLADGYAVQRRGRRSPFRVLANWLVFAQVRRRLGLDAARILVSAAAPISLQTSEFFLSLGMPLMEVYGLSECMGPGAVGAPHQHRTGWVGRALPGTELAVSPSGELCLRGRHIFKGYLKDPVATAAAIDEEGWLHSGDLGEISDGFVRVTGRRKEMLVLSSGDKIAPQLVEGKLQGITGVSRVVAVGEGRPHVSVLVTLDPKLLAAVAGAAQTRVSSVEEASRSAEVLRWLWREVEKVNQTLDASARVSGVTLLQQDFSLERGELTPTMKLKRKVVCERYAAEISAMYPQERSAHADLALISPPAPAPS